MSSHTVIRGEFIRRYADVHRKMRDESWNLIARRDELLCKLNRDYGFLEEDGSVRIDPGTGTYDEYKRQNVGIETQFREVYDTQLPMFYNWCRENGITIFEYLLLDNIDLVDEDASKIAESCGTEQDWCFGAIEVKAKLFVEKLTSDQVVGEIKRRINLELNHRSYANARCRKFFAIKPWEFSKQKAVFNYGRSYKSALLQTFGNLKAI